MLLKAGPLKSSTARARVEALFAACGVERERLDLRGQVDSFVEHLAAYEEVDIALDPFPYNGTTTTCEALWMGVPVVSLAGRTHVSRVGVSILSRSGSAELIADNQSAYVSRAVQLARDLSALRTLREALRPRVRSSLLADAALATAELERAYAGMWEKQRNEP
jgi:predicted O-linked N-acetylglucosamine transferase (SPINDLY family)